MTKEEEADRLAISLARRFSMWPFYEMQRIARYVVIDLGYREQTTSEPAPSDENISQRDED